MTTATDYHTRIDSERLALLLEGIVDASSDDIPGLLNEIRAIREEMGHELDLATQQLRDVNGYANEDELKRLRQAIKTIMAAVTTTEKS